MTQEVQVLTKAAETGSGNRDVLEAASLLLLLEEQSSHEDSAAKAYLYAPGTSSSPDEPFEFPELQDPTHHQDFFDEDESILSKLHHPGVYHFFFETLYDSSSWETFGSEGRTTRLLTTETSFKGTNPLQKSQKGNTCSLNSGGLNERCNLTSSASISSSGNTAKRSSSKASSSAPHLSTAKRRKKNSANSAEDDPNGVQRRCGHCLATETPMWRNGPPGFGDLCNKVSRVSQTTASRTQY